MKRKFSLLKILSIKLQVGKYSLLKFNAKSGSLVCPKKEASQKARFIKFKMLRSKKAKFELK